MMNLTFEEFKVTILADLKMIVIDKKLDDVAFCNSELCNFSTYKMASTDKVTFRLYCLIFSMYGLIGKHSPVSI